MSQLVRTTLRLPVELKKAADQRALDTDSSLQEIFIQALRQYLKSKEISEAHTIVFPHHSLGVPLDNITREDIYGDEL